MARLQIVDLNLDTLIYNGGNAVCNSLWMGVPSITVEGSNYASRIATSILRSLDLEECITHSINEYKNKIIELINNPQQLQNLRKKILINKHNSSLFNSQKYSKNLEFLYKEMWNEYASGKTLSIIRV